VVFLTAVEEGFCPTNAAASIRATGRRTAADVLGITRAQQELHLSLARYRDFRGSAA